MTVSFKLLRRLEPALCVRHRSQLRRSLRNISLLQIQWLREVIARNQP